MKNNLTQTGDLQSSGSDPNGGSFGEKQEEGRSSLQSPASQMRNGPWQWLPYFLVHTSPTEIWGYQLDPRAQPSVPIERWLANDAEGIALVFSLLDSLTPAPLEELCP